MASLKKKNNQIDIALDKTSFSIPYKPNEGREKKKLKPIISKIRELNNLSKSGERSKSLFPRCWTGTRMAGYDTVKSRFRAGSLNERSLIEQFFRQISSLLRMVGTQKQSGSRPRFGCSRAMQKGGWWWRWW